MAEGMNDHLWRLAFDHHDISRLLLLVMVAVVWDVGRLVYTTTFSDSMLVGSARPAFWMSLSIAVQTAASKMVPATADSISSQPSKV